MKKVGLAAGIGFLTGALFFALFFGYFHESGGKERKNEPGNEKLIGVEEVPEDGGDLALEPPTARAETAAINGMELNFAPLVKKVRPAVVKVMSESIRKREGFGDDLLDRFLNEPRGRDKVPGVGSGFFISEDGYLITNNHVVKDAVKVTVRTIDKKEYTARTVGTDPRTDLALLKIDAANLPFIQLGDSNKVEVGEWVLAIGNPLDQDLTVTAGIISAKGRQLGMADYEDFLQTDAAINRGNSGGPLVNMEGKVIGINSVILAPSGGNIGIGFAIPSNMAEKVVRDLKSKGRVVRGYLGVSVQFLDKKDVEDFANLAIAGALVVKVEKDSPADIAGLKKFDLIVAVDGKKIKTNNDLAIKIAEASPGDTVKLTIYRKGDSDKEQKIEIKVEVSEAPDTMKYRSPGEEGRSFDLGMVLVENSPALVKEYKLKTSKGILVTRVDRGSAAAENGILPLDVILEVNGKAVGSVGQFRKIISGKRPGALLLLYINRAGEEGAVKFRLPE